MEEEGGRRRGGAGVVVVVVEVGVEVEIVLAPVRGGETAAVFIVSCVDSVRLSEPRNVMMLMLLPWQS